MLQPADPGAIMGSGITNMILLRENLVVGAVRVRVRRSGAERCRGVVSSRECFQRSGVLTSDEWGDVSFSFAKVRCRGAVLSPTSCPSPTLMPAHTHTLLLLMAPLMCIYLVIYAG